MPNKIIPPDKAAKGILKIMKDSVKQVCPDKPGQDPEVFNKEQKDLLGKVANTFSEYMFCRNINKNKINVK